MHIQKLKNKSGITYRAIVKYKGTITSKVHSRRYDAEKWAKDTLDKKTIGIDPNITFEGLSKKWLENHSSIKNTAKTYLDNVAKLAIINPILGPIKAQDVSYDGIENLRTIITMGKDREPITINRFIKLSSTIFNYGIRCKNISNNPVMKEHYLDEVEQGFRYWQMEEAELFIVYAINKYRIKNQFVILVYLIALNTGARLGEIVGLKWDCVFLGKNPSITFKRSFCDRTRKLQETTKSKRIRYVGINEALLPALKKAYQNRNLNNDYVVQTDDGNMMDARNFRERYFKKDIKESGVTPIKFHDLRHTYASLFVMNNGNIFDLQKILGHQSLQMTQRYSHLTKDYILDKSNVVVVGNTNKIISVDFQKKKAL